MRETRAIFFDVRLMSGYANAAPYCSNVRTSNDCRLIPAIDGKSDDERTEAYKPLRYGASHSLLTGLSHSQ